ncbi:MAG: hypothetical protein IJE25_06325 [Clostridia bacterium]|nr:hypothetical protein [Clostridia bacterium]
MRKLKLLIPIFLILSILLCSCVDTPDSGSGTKPSFDTVTVDEAIADYETAKDDFKSYCLEITVRSIKDATVGEISAFDASGNLGVNMLFKKVNGGRVEFPDFASTIDEGDILVVNANLTKDDSGKVNAWRAEVLYVTKAALALDPLSAIRDLEDGTEVVASGTVAAIAYSGGSKVEPCGVIIVDKTSSIYVYDQTIASTVKVGNTVTVEGTIGHWVLDTEKTNAEKFGYKGSCQIENATLVDNDGKTADFDKSWIEEISVKELLEISVTENVTTKLYKVNALVKEVPGAGFTNYYFFDIDGTTGTYAYTQCNGNDFEWIREFDGKFCTVYITPLNAKSTSSDCFFRFLPVQIIDEGYKFDTADAPEYAVKYHGMTQLKGSYTGDPELSLIGSVSSELLGFEGVSLKYLSSNEAIIKFTEADGGYIMNCPGYGKATVTVVATLGGNEYSETIEITVSEPEAIPSITPSAAILADEGEEITVKGIVGPSYVHANRRGFYLIGEEGGIIAVSFANVDDLKDIAIGNTVFIKATGKVEYVDAGFSKTYYVGGVQLYSSNALIQYSILSEFNGSDATVILSVVNWNGKGYKLTVVGVEGADGNIIYNQFSFDDAK